MIRFERVSFRYPGASHPALDGVDLGITEGELALVIGPTGSGKTTLLRTVNGLVPRFSGGILTGRVVVAGYDTSRVAVRELADIVGLVAQDPTTGFVTDTVEEELAYTMEQLGLAPQVMRKRVEETLDLMGLSRLRSRRLAELSGGEAQRVAIGAVLTAHPRVMLLDEPTSALDPAAAEEVLAALTRLVHDLGTTVLMAEHRLERVVQYADRIVHLDSYGRATTGDPSSMMEQSLVAPPVVHLGRLAGWKPLPLSVRDARRRSAEVAGRLAAFVPPTRTEPEPCLEVRDLSVGYGPVEALQPTTFRLGAGEVVAVMGRNGVGKSSLLWAIQGSGTRTGGSVRVSGRDPADMHPAAARRLVGLVPHTPSDLLFMETVAEECDRSDQTSEAAPGTTLRLVERILEAVDLGSHPADLSEGEKLGLVLAIQLSAGPSLLLLDEPTRGLDYAAKERLASIIGRVAAQGAGVMIATHDVEFVAEAADRVIVLADGEIVADGPTGEVVVSSPIFAPQVAKIFAPGAWLTVNQVAVALEPA
ncbi:MAG TPA: ATP-binding cassette domain-containing protein [Acidimicrobiia bacterium]|nr:ATP-binding cassette domain-containing protein [Acidimicrobiia bacterium]